jgi:ribosomal protein L11 methyltransferase
MNTLVALRMELDSADADRLGDAMMARGALAVTAEDADAGTEREVPVFDEPGNDPSSWPRLRLEVLVATGDDPLQLLEAACADAEMALPPYNLSQVPDADWVRATQAQFGPIAISSRLWIVPSWHSAPEPAAVNLLLDPGVAFGTGSHPTTRLCLQWLERQLAHLAPDLSSDRRPSVLDYGCGSGILAIAAMKLGAGSAIGVDIDAGAVLAARDNAIRNQVPCEFVTLPELTPPPALQVDLLLANILANPLRVLAPVLAAHTRPGGRLALSGILVPQADDIMQRYAQWFDFEPPLQDEGWVCLSGRRHA